MQNTLLYSDFSGGKRAMILLNMYHMPGKNEGMIDDMIVVAFNHHTLID